MSVTQATRAKIDSNVSDSLTPVERSTTELQGDLLELTPITREE